ncbi:MAG: hypothetical protein HF973_16225 [Chloroflexi bacterium]|nr:hypothetical protein [Chloroflexota bacterium]
MKTRLIFLVLAVWGLATAVPFLYAHGGGDLQIANASVAGYIVSIWTAPNNPQAGEDLHVTVGVGSEALGAKPVLDAQVEIEVFAENGELAASAPATTEQSANKLFYEADLPELAAGTYRVVVTVSGSEGSGAVDFSLQIRPSASKMSWIIGGIVLVVLGGTAVFWYWRQQRED